jgi:uncharacterized protein (TIGR01244 family)
MTIYRMSAACAVAGQIRPEDIETIAADGYTTIVCNRPDLEEFGQPLAEDIRKECEERGLTFLFIPIDRSGLTMNMVEEFRRAVEESEGPLLAYCRSGQRSAAMWQASGAP